MIRTNSTQKSSKFVVQGGQVQSMSPFNSAIRLSSHQLDAPSTPQRQIISNNPLRMVINQPDVRQSTNNSFTPNGKLVKSQENKSIIVQDQRVQQLINDNHYLVQALEQARSELRNSQENQQLELIKSRMENLEHVIDEQAQEIEIWKKKYNQACVGDPTQDSMQQMESQILLVIQENERLNCLIKNIQETIDQKDSLIQQFQLQHQQQEGEVKKLREKQRNQERTMTAQKEEIRQWQDAFNEFEKSQKTQVNNEAELLKSKIKIQELEFQLHKRKISETGSGKASQREESEMGGKVRQLLDENTKLTQLVTTMQEENQRLKQGNTNGGRKQSAQLEQLRQELLRQQLFSQEEFAKIRKVLVENQNLQEQLRRANEQIRFLENSVSQLSEVQSEPSDQLFEEFLQSQKNSLSLVQQLI